MWWYLVDDGSAGGMAEAAVHNLAVVKHEVALLGLELNEQ